MSKNTNRSKKGRKVGRSLAKCQRYRAQARREKNKQRRVNKHCRGNPNDVQALALLKTYGLARA